ncbi:hypothetical protein [Paraburkholderia tropica]|uniref:hypothetical protein n=1 Tax=Paraburkholderia tropica TaxID=92647 RepID=UPI000F555653|nr:hypothetical protein [Paraburkholderia tropica]RQN35676.1 hypothetical protein EHZ25_27740 [Paraburkholderia tropica]
MESLTEQAELTRQFVSAVEAHCVTQAAASKSSLHREPATERAKALSAKAIEQLLGIAEPTGRTWNAYRRGDRSWPLRTLEQKIGLAERARLISTEMASALQRKVRLAAIEDAQPAIGPIFEHSVTIVQEALALAEFHRKHNGAGCALDILRPLLDYAERIRAEANSDDSAMEGFLPPSPDEDL